MRCSNCGIELPDNVSFCENCGAEIHRYDEKPHYIYCGNCGAKNPDYLQICDRCGKKLNIGKPSSKKYRVVIAALAILLLGTVSVIFSYIFAGGGTGNEIKETNALPATPSAMPASPSPAAPSDEEATDVGRWETYYVVNCDADISLLEAPDSSAKELKTIPLGDPVSYIEPAQNGFAKIIYNGTTGYALQAYLSDNAEDIKKNSSNNTASVDSSTANRSDSLPPSDGRAAGGVIKNPVYYTYTDPEYNLTCSYPAHFMPIYNDDPFVRISLAAPDGTAVLNICATENSSGLSVKTVLDNFKDSFPGAVDYENSGTDWCVCRTYKDGIYHYGYFKIKNGLIRGFEMHFSGEYYRTYDGYVNDIYESLSFN